MSASPLAVAAAEKALLDEGAAPGSSIHSWRCEYPETYGPCDCVQQTAVIVASAVAAAAVREALEAEAADVDRRADEHDLSDGTFGDYGADLCRAIAQSIRERIPR